MSMKAFVFDGAPKLVDIPVPKPAPHEALVRVTLAGFCRTDIEICRGYMGYTGVLGHEFVGLVCESPDPLLVGARVVGEINAGCGACEFCGKGLARHCPNRTVLGISKRPGAFAEYVALPVNCLIPVPENLPDEKAVFVEPVAAALEILEQVKIEPASRVLVIGDGRLGLLVCMALRLTGCDLTLAGHRPEKTRFFTALGGKAVHSSDEIEPASFDTVVEASGNPSGWETAVAALKPRGTLVLKSTYADTLTFNASLLVINEITVVGSRCGRFEPALRLLDAGLIDPTPLITATYPLERAEEAFAHAERKGALKVLIQCS
jgi:threonine dehydrogenase-like Zn-dependent dehydrogenase